VVSHAPWQSVAARWEPVTMTRQIDNANAPQDFSERFARIPTGSERVRIDRFETVTGPRFEVYLAGTDFAAGPDNPWWVGANTEMLASGASRSMSAAESALDYAGVTGTTPIVLTGHSQGGAIAVALANSGRYAVDAVFTAGTPAGLVESSANVPIVHVVHPEDPVPALGGVIRGTAGTTWIIHTEPRTTGTDAHLAANYQESLRRLDSVRDPGLTTLENRLRTDGLGTAMWFRATLAGD
jgi:pimeloyl-ACP methyl ester carboxylesterase